MTATNLRIYKCPVCDTVVEVLDSQGLELVCCGPTMVEVRERTAVRGDRHVPVVEKTQRGVRVKVGSTPHRMESSHYIEWIEVISDGKRYRQFLKPGQRAEADFELSSGAVTARVYCSIDGLWRSLVHMDSTEGGAFKPALSGQGEAAGQVA